MSYVKTTVKKDTTIFPLFYIITVSFLYTGIFIMIISTRTVKRLISVDCQITNLYDKDLIVSLCLSLLFLHHFVIASA